MSAELIAKNAYRVTLPVEARKEDEANIAPVALVHLIWDTTDQEVVLRCRRHSLHMAVSSTKVPPCLCIADVMALREEAKLTDSKD